MQMKTQKTHRKLPLSLSLGSSLATQKSPTNPSTLCPTTAFIPILKKPTLSLHSPNSHLTHTIHLSSPPLHPSSKKTTTVALSIFTNQKDDLHERQTESIFSLYPEASHHFSS